MAKNKAQAQSTDVRKKAQDMREAQRKADVRTRNIIIGVVSLLVVAIAVAIVMIIVNRPSAEQSAQGLPEEFRNGEPIVVNTQGVSAGPTEQVDDQLAFYFDYTCGGCVALDSAVGPDLFEGASAGDLTLALHPVMTHNAPFNLAATSAAIQVAASDPTNFAALHQALIEFSYQSMVDQDTSVLNDLENSKTKVAEIAAQVGIPQAVIDSFDTDAGQAYLDATSAAWRTTEAEGRGEGLSSPEMVYNKVQLTPAGQTGTEIYQSILSQMAEISGN
ncbi:MAG: DsbA family protein [Scrofimicrobium sp.]